MSIAGLLIACMLINAARAQTDAPPPNATHTEVKQPSIIDANGFRSARFGMAEAEVRQAITADFALKAALIRADDQPGEQTRILRIKVPDVLPQGGVAEIAYILGYKSRKLMQVSLTWSHAIDDQLKPETLLTNAQMLATYFQGRGYKTETIVANSAIPGGIIVFRAQDAHDRTTLLLLRGQTADAKGQQVFTPTSLNLLYIEDALHPDVYRLPQGQF